MNQRYSVVWLRLCVAEYEIIRSYSSKMNQYNLFHTETNMEQKSLSN